MATQRFVRTKTIIVEECERCSESHDFPIEIIFDREMDAVGMMTPGKYESQEVILACPKTQKSIVISVTEHFDSLESLARIRQK